jgi:2-polyprenyl-6-hydroxyphenyl methylase/3-demethylubiquinone-9 3-methyltransferase
MAMIVKDRLDAPWGSASTVDPEEIARFNALAQEWWNPRGRFQPIHDFNEVRCGYIIDRIAGHFRRNCDTLDELRILDVGCGAGLICEPLAERKASVVGIDAAARNIEIAKRHSTEHGLNIDYRHCLAEHLVETEAAFDVVLNTEVIEHVADPGLLMQACSSLVRPGGIMIVATLNRTLRAYVLAIVAAEFVLRWLPVGTHDWHRFLRPQEIEGMIAPHSLSVTDSTGVAYNPVRRRWRLTRDTSVNYMLTAERTDL